MNKFKILCIVFLGCVSFLANAQKGKNKKNNKKERVSQQKNKADKKMKIDKKENSLKKEKQNKKDKKDKKNKGKNKKEKEQNNAENEEQTTINSQAENSTGLKQMLSKDTTKPNVVTITSAFKPVLRTAAKINFTASTPELDTTKLQLNYNIPAQNLFFTYQPVAIKPLSLGVDSSFDWKNNHYIKFGAGNLSTIYGEAGFSFGNPNNILYNIKADYIQGKGNLIFQDYAKANFIANASFGTIKNHDFVASISYQMNNQNKFGTKAGIVFNADSLKQNFNNIGVDLALQNKLPNSFGISYKPKIGFNYFFDNNKAKEVNLLVSTPIIKNINEKITFVIDANADITSYKKDSITVNNNVFAISPSLQFGNKVFKVNAGFKPTWNNQEFAFLPNIKIDYKLANEKLTLSTGWNGFIQKNTYKSLALFNPFIYQLNYQTNTTINEQFVGIKGSLGKHFSFNAQTSFIQYKNLALFANDSINAKSHNFEVLYEPKINAIKLAAEIGYTDKEKLSLITGLQFIQFTNQDSFPKAFGIVPLQLTASAKYKVLKDVFLKSDIFLATGNNYRLLMNQTSTTKTALDVNVGVEFKMMDKLNLYLDINNLFNNQYQRWNQYTVLGFNVVAGFVYSFK